MSCKSETGHAKSVANFGTMILILEAFGTVYNPSKQSLSIQHLKETQWKADQSISKLNKLMPIYKKAIAERMEAFEPLSKLVTGVKNAVALTGASHNLKDNIASVASKITGSSKSSKKANAETVSTTADSSGIKSISTSQMGYDNRLANFDRLIQLVSEIESYRPNEQELQLGALSSLYEGLKQKNLSATMSEIPVNNARIERNNIFYKENVGICALALDVKTYMKSVLGTSNPNFKQLSKLQVK